MKAQYLKTENLYQATGSYYVESNFEENFQSANLDINRWTPQGSCNDPLAVPKQGGTPCSPAKWAYHDVVGGSDYAQRYGPVQSHCPAKGAVGASSPASCTTYNPKNLFLNSPLPGYSTKGAILSINQQNCFDASGKNNPDCCDWSSGVYVCSSWSGSHLQSQSVVQYGILEYEAAINLPAGGGAEAFFATYMIGCSNLDATPLNPSADPSTQCDPSWNEVDTAFSNSPEDGQFEYSTDLFMSKVPLNLSKYDLNVGFGNLQYAGLFSHHGPTGCMGKYSKCVGPFPDRCTAAPLDYPTVNQTAIKAGVAPSVAGGTCPPFVESTATTTYSNYKTIHTPTWIAWMINDVVMRNETWDVRPNYVPWRPMTIRPILRTNIGSAPVISGTYTDPVTKVQYKVSVPAGLIQSYDKTTFASQFISNNFINEANEAYVNLTTNWKTMPDAKGLYPDYANKKCNPCNLPAVKPSVVIMNAKLTGASLSFLPASNVNIRRIKYTALSANSLANVSAAFTALPNGRYPNIVARDAGVQNALKSKASFTPDISSWGVSSVAGTGSIATSVTLTGSVPLFSYRRRLDATSSSVDLDQAASMLQQVLSSLLSGLLLKVTVDAPVPPSNEFSYTISYTTVDHPDQASANAAAVAQLSDILASGAVEQGLQTYGNALGITSLAAATISTNVTDHNIVIVSKQSCSHVLNDYTACVEKDLSGHHVDCMDEFHQLEKCFATVFSHVCVTFSPTGHCRHKAETVAGMITGAVIGSVLFGIILTLCVLRYCIPPTKETATKVEPLTILPSDKTEKVLA